MVLFELGVFFISLIVLAVAAHSTLRSTINLAQMLGIGEFAVSFILVALATSMPELLVSIQAGLVGNGNIIIGNIVGSNIANTLVVLGLTAFFGTITIRQEEYEQNIIALLGISLISLLLLLRGSIGFYTGVILIIVFLGYSLMISKTNISLSIKNPIFVTTIFEKIIRKKGKIFQLGGQLVAMGIGVLFVILSSFLLVDSALKMAEIFSLKESVIGLTLIAFGTSAPEIAIAIVAIWRKKFAVAVGETFGSSIANLTLVLGTGAILTPITIDFLTVGYAFIYLLIISLILWYFISTKKPIDKRVGILFLIGYVVFILGELSLIPAF